MDSSPPAADAPSSEQAPKKTQVHAMQEAATEISLALFAYLLCTQAGLLLYRAVAGVPSILALVLLSPILTGLSGLLYRKIAELLTGKPTPRRPSDRPPASWPRSLAISAIATVAIVGGGLVIGQIMELFGAAPAEQAEILQLTAQADTWTWAAMIAGPGIAAPLAEEYVYRHLLFLRMSTAVGPRLALVICTLLFAAIHNNWSGFAIYAWIGWCCAQAYLQSNRFVCAVGTHLANNALTLLLLAAKSS